MRIREYSPADKVQILQLHVEFEQEFSPDIYLENSLSTQSELEERYTYFIHQEGQFWVMEERGVVVGLIGVQLQENDRAELIQLRVRKSHQRRGIATLLIKKVEETALFHGKKQIYLQTAEPLIKARTLYGKLGYILENTSKFSGFTVMTYKKDLVTTK
ncbi:MAG: GNAT family N-acetyltransferase [Candidatus Heimdallarchaeota archaeon]